MQEITLFKETESGNEPVLTIKKDVEYYRYLFLKEAYDEYDNECDILKSFAIKVIPPYFKYDVKIQEALQERDGNVIFFEISQHPVAEKPQDLFGYSWMLFDKNDNILADEGDGEMKIGRVMRRFMDICGFTGGYFDSNDFCYADFLGIDCYDYGIDYQCRRCEDDDY